MEGRPGRHHHQPKQLSAEFLPAERSITPVHSALHHSSAHHEPPYYMVHGGPNLAGPSSAAVHHVGADVPLPVHSGTFLQSKRHHQHYFSNTDLFAQGRDGYNYLRYAKADEMQPVISGQPHLVVKSVSFERDTRTPWDRRVLRAPVYQRVLDGVSLEARGGETLAVMATDEAEVSALFSLMANVHPAHGRTQGTFFLNGIQMGSRSLGSRVAYVRVCEPQPGLTVRQHLRMQAMFARPATHAFKAKHMVSQLIQTLALAPFQDRLAGELGRTEKMRLNIACQILMDTDILLLDNVTKLMDLYDAAFVIDYLRDWATKLNRIVIMATNPPTYEILAMFYKVDLLTYDHLTAEAANESRERIGRLCDMWDRSPQSQFEVMAIGQAPPRVTPVSAIGQVATIYRRFWMLFVNQPGSVLGELALSFVTSVYLGIFWFQMTRSMQAGINDRIGLIYAILVVGMLPNLWLNMSRAVGERRLVYTDLGSRRYGPTAYTCARLLFDLPLSLLTYTLYTFPVYLMAGFMPYITDDVQGGPENLAHFMANALLCCLCLRWMAVGLAFLCERRFVAATVMGGITCAWSLSSGVTAHLSDALAASLLTLRLTSPIRMAVGQLVQAELMAGPVRFQNGQILPPEGSTPLTFRESVRTVRVLPGQEQTPIVLTSVIDTSGRKALIFSALSPITDWLEVFSSDFMSAGHRVIWVPMVALCTMAIVCMVCMCCCMRCNHPPKVRVKHRD